MKSCKNGINDSLRSAAKNHRFKVYKSKVNYYPTPNPSFPLLTRFLSPDIAQSLARDRNWPVKCLGHYLKYGKINDHYQLRLLPF